jgi:hypothetical protein
MKPILACLLLFVSITAFAETNWFVRFGIGESANAPQSFTIEQTNTEDMVVENGRFSSRGLERPWLYALRIGALGETTGWELELIHHKLHLDDSRSYDPRLAHFEITHGYNFFLINHIRLSQRWQGVEYRLGAGTNYVHPDVRFDDDLDGRVDRSNYVTGNNVLLSDWRVGYHWGGYAVQASVAKTWMREGWALMVEPKLHHNQVTVPVDDGQVSLANTSLGLYVSLGYQF